MKTEVRDLESHLSYLRATRHSTMNDRLKRANCLIISSSPMKTTKQIRMTTQKAKIYPMVLAANEAIRAPGRQLEVLQSSAIAMFTNRHATNRSQQLGWALLDKALVGCMPLAVR